MRRRFIIDRNRIPFTVDNYLTIEALEDGLVVNFPNEIEYGIDGMGWFTLPPSTDSPQINTGHTISFRARLIPFELEGVGTFVISKKCNIIGNCMSLLFGDYSNENFNLIGYNYAFSYLFKDCNTVISVDENILPATSISSSCYYGMFEGCTSLVNAPKLPATILDFSCYYGMFEGCTSLVNAPELPATTLVGRCYSCMFYNCKKLNYIKMLATDISAYYCLMDWVYNVAPIGTFVKNKDATWDVRGVSGISSNWKIEYDHNYDIGSDISFHIERIDETLYAKDWMTWDDWVHSKYNTVSARISGHEILIPSYSSYPLDTYPNNIIKNGGTYYFKNTGGGSSD